MPICWNVAVHITTCATIPASPAQVFTLAFHSSSPRNVGSSSLSLTFRGPGESNSAIVVFSPAQDMTLPSPSSDLHGF